MFGTRRMTAVAIVAVGAVGCARFVPPATRPITRPPTAISTGFSSAWNAVIDLFVDEGRPIQLLDRASGVVVSSVARWPSSLADTLIADCGLYYNAGGMESVYVPDRVQYNVVVRGDSSHSTIHVAAFWGLSLPSGVTDWSCVSRQVYEVGIESRIKARAEQHP